MKTIEKMEEIKEKLEKAKLWFKNVTKVDYDVVGFPLISQVELLEAHDKTMASKTR